MLLNPFRFLQFLKVGSVTRNSWILLQFPLGNIPEVFSRCTPRFPPRIHSEVSLRMVPQISHGILGFLENRKLFQKNIREFFSHFHFFHKYLRELLQKFIGELIPKLLRELFQTLMLEFFEQIILIPLLKEPPGNPIEFHQKKKKFC